MSAILVSLVAVPARATDDRGSLTDGYRLMYGSQFTTAAQWFEAWRRDRPLNPLGPASEAANILFTEFERLGILQAQFFTNDTSFTSKRQVDADPALRARFDRALDETARMAQARLQTDGHDRDALFALTLVSGLRADYAALIEGRNLASLSYTRDGSRAAKKLLAVAPEDGDALLATGINDYVIGSLPLPFRWVLRLGGYSGDKRRGVEQLTHTARHGTLLAPLARILLAIAYLRDGDRTRARDLLTALSREFPSNVLFVREIKRLDQKEPG